MYVVHVRFQFQYQARYIHIFLYNFCFADGMFISLFSKAVYVEPFFLDTKNIWCFNTNVITYFHIESTIQLFNVM